MPPDAFAAAGLVLRRPSGIFLSRPFGRSGHLLEFPLVPDGELAQMKSGSS
jgi:hypothetical protein